MIYQGEYIIIGPPGCGKTRRVSQSVERIVEKARVSLDRDPVLVCSLTRTAAAEASGRVNLRKEMVGTLHAHAYRALGHPDMLDGAAVRDFNEQYPAYAMTAEATALDEEAPPEAGADGDQPGDLIAARYTLARARREDPRSLPGSVPRFAEVYEAWKRKAGVMDFADLIDEATETCPTAPHDPRVIIADEAQDMSAAEFELIRRWGEAAGAEILVGDPWQALYSWRGADPDYLVRRRVADDHRDVLSQSHRVPAAVHDLATRWVRQLSTWSPIAYRPTDDPGEVRRLGDATWRRPEAIVQYAEELWSDGGSVMILGSCGYMLGPTLSALKSRAMPFSNPWRRRRGDWNPLTPGQGKGVGRRFCDFCEFLMRWADRGTWVPEEAWSWIRQCRVTGLLARGSKGTLESMATDLDVAGVESPIADLKPLLAAEAAEEIDRLATMWRDAPRSAMPEMTAWYERRMAGGTRSANLDYAMRVAVERGPKWLMAEDERPGLGRVYVGSIHSFKGAEADHVILMPDLSMKGYDQHSTDPDPTIRQFYVGLTRAKRSVTLVEPDGERCVDLASFLG